MSVSGVISRTYGHACVHDVQEDRRTGLTARSKVIKKSEREFIKRFHKINSI